MKAVKLIPLMLVLVLLFSGCGNRAVLTVGDEKISYDTYRYFYLNFKNNGDYTEEELHEMVIDTLSKDAALTLLAEKYEIGLNKEEQESADDYVEAAIAGYGSKDAFKKALEENHMTEKLFRYLYSQQLLENKLREYMYNEMNNIIKSDDATLDADIEKNFMAAKQVLIRNDKGEDKAENKALAESILKKAKNGEDFDALMKEYSEDTSADSGYVYYFTYGQMVEGFESAAADTPVGSLCGYVAESEAGYHIIMRMPLDPEYIDSHYEELREAYKARCFNEMRQEIVKSLKIKKTRGFDKIDFNE